MDSKILVSVLAFGLTLGGCATQPVAGDNATKPATGESKSESASSKAATGKDAKPKEPVALARPYTTPKDPYPSTYEPPQTQPTLIRGATVLTGTGAKLENADVLVVEGRARWC
jgi:hypothetical protein